MRPLVRQHLRFFAIFTAAAFALRLVFLWKLRFVAGDSFIYGDIAKNWIQHGSFALSEGEGFAPTYIRLPGFPGFMALIWLITGVEHYVAVMVVQMFLDVGTCFLTAAIALRAASERAALAAFALATLCPFTANYAVTPLAEIPSVFFAALALLCAIEALGRWPAGFGWWAGCGVATAASILLRPDGGLLLAAVVLYLVVRMFTAAHRRQTLSALVLVAAISLASLVPWALRNWRDFHRFEPLAPRYTTAPEEYVPVGFIRWIKTWIVDYVSVEDIYWKVPGDPIDVHTLPSRAFDNAEERSLTAELFQRYNQTSAPLAPDLDSAFGSLAERRIALHPLRYYVGLPVLRVADMWLRPRAEALPLDPRWWKFRQDPRDAGISVLLGTINLVLVIASLVALLRGRVRYAALFVIWVLLRSVLLATLENPETRYTLECLPVVFVFAAANYRPSHKSALNGRTWPS